VALDIEETYARFGPMVLRRCRWLLRDDAKAEDALHDVFVALLRHGGRLEPTATSALLLRVATNVCLNRLRGERRRPETADEDLLLRIAAAGAPEARTAARDLIAKLFRADDALAASTGTIAVMHLLDGLTLEETAREAGLSVSGVRKRLRSLRTQIGELVKET
jgi:RNA polymerase sigma-70 factor (ECF subfamily)